MIKFNFHNHGFEIINLGESKNIKLLRKKIIDIFSYASKFNGLGKLKNDQDIEKLYKKNKKVWISAYDQARMLPDIYNVINGKIINKICKIAKIKFPSLTSKPIIRICMPNGVGTSLTDLHIDYPTHRGSKNSITIWIPLQKTNKINGTLRLSPFSQKEKNFYGSIENSSVIRKKKIESKKNVNPEIKLGEAIILSQFTVHASEVNYSDQIRFSLDFRLNDLSDKDYAKRLYYINEKNYFKKI